MPSITLQTRCQIQVHFFNVRTVFFNHDIRKSVRKAVCMSIGQRIITAVFGYIPTHCQNRGIALIIGIYGGEKLAKSQSLLDEDQAIHRDKAIGNRSKHTEGLEFKKIFGVGGKTLSVCRRTVKETIPMFITKNFQNLLKDLKGLGN